MSQPAPKKTCVVLCEESAAQTSPRSEPRSLDECMAVLSDPQVIQHDTLRTNVCLHAFLSCFVKRLLWGVFQRGPQKLSDAEVMNLVTSCKILNYKLEAVLESPERGVAIRREMLSLKLPVTSALASLPYKGYDYSKVLASSSSVNCSSFS